uniref:MFS domain-containing protein n=1 Tax=Rhabditophanes sp. KR3021 TaxID=114890 RepID=A0AC35TPW5_9BILA
MATTETDHIITSIKPNNGGEETIFEEAKGLLSHKDAAKTLNGVEPKELTGKLTGALLFAVFASAIGGSFVFGYHIGCINAPGDLIQKWIGDNHFQIHSSNIQKSEIDMIWAVTVAIFSIGGMIGGLLSGTVADKMGRKGGLLANNGLIMIAGLFMGLAKHSNFYYMMIMGRLIIGLACGLASGLVPMYLCEIAPPNLRGTLGSVHQLAVTISILFSQILGHPSIFGTEELWQYIFLFTLIPSGIQLALLPFAPESPKWILNVKNSPETAAAALKKLRGTDDVQDELDQFIVEAEETRNTEKAGLLDMFKGDLRQPMIIAIMMMLSQQLSGINAAMFYSTSIFMSAKLSAETAVYATIGMGLVNVIQTLVSTWLVDHPKFGRKPLHLAGLSGMLITSLGLVAALTMQNSNVTEAIKSIGSYASIAFVLLFVVSFATGPGSIPWFFVSEIFTSSARGTASSIACMVNWTAAFLVGLLFPTFQRILGQYTFLIFVGFLGFFIFYTYKFVPETKGKSVDQIKKELEKK